MSDIQAIRERHEAVEKSDMARFFYDAALQEQAHADRATLLSALSAAEARAEAAEARVGELEADKDRLDFLDQCNRRLNEHYGTDYGWELIINMNVTRLFFKDIKTLDLNDSKGGHAKLNSCRDAIDASRTLKGATDGR